MVGQRGVNQVAALIVRNSNTRMCFERGTLRALSRTDLGAGLLRAIPAHTRRLKCADSKAFSFSSQNTSDVTYFHHITVRRSHFACFRELLAAQAVRAAQRGLGSGRL
jgi:hypothetical protein